MNEKSSSGELNAKHRELLDLHTLARSRFEATKHNFADGMRAAEEVKRDLNWTQNRISWVVLAILNQALRIVLLARGYPTDVRAESLKPKLNASIRLSTEQLRINIVQSLRSKDDEPSALCSPDHPLFHHFPIARFGRYLWACTSVSSSAYDWTSTTSLYGSDFAGGDV